MKTLWKHNTPILDGTVGFCEIIASSLFYTKLCFELILLEKPKIASLEKSLLYANIGDEIILPCDVSGTPRPIFKWVRRGGNFNLKDSRFKVTVNQRNFDTSIQ